MRSKQEGYLMVVVAILLVTVAFSSLVISYIFSNKSQSSINSLMSMQAYYISQSGLERAVYDITVNGLACTAINGTTNYTNFTFTNAPGTFTVTGADTETATTLNGAITASASTLTVASSSNLDTYGTVAIENELINYSTISGNNLTGLTRGVGGTTAASHANGVSVNQNECVLTSVGGVPSVTSPITKRTLVEILQGNSFSIGQSSSGAGTGAGSSAGTDVGIYIPSLVVATGTVPIGASDTVTNAGVTSSSPDFTGSTIISANNVTVSSTGKTQVSNGAGALVNSSTSSATLADISKNNTIAAKAALWSQYFTQSKATVQASANQSYNSGNINGATGKLIWTSAMTLSAALPITIGSATSPVVLIVNGNLSLSLGTITINGFLYVTGNLSVAAPTTFIMNGAIATEGSMSTNGVTTINANPGILSLANNLTTAAIPVYSFVPTYLQESFA